MSPVHAVLASVLAFTFAVAACEGHTSLAPDSEDAAASASVVLDGNDGCTETGTGLDAVVVNEDVVDAKVVIGDCDVGAYFDEDGVVENATFEQPETASAPNEQSLVRVDGADVDVLGSTFHANEDYVHQILHIAYVGGATEPDGASNDIFHLGAVVFAGTNNGLRQNSISTSSNAEAGIFVAANATNTKLIRNTFSGDFAEEIVDGGDETKLPKPFRPQRVTLTA